MTKKITLTAHIQEINIDLKDRKYQVVLIYEENDNRFVADNCGKGYSLIEAEHMFAVLQKICVGEYEIPTKMAR